MESVQRTLAGVAQLVELQPSKLDVAGSSPVARSSIEAAHVAQLVEHVLGKDEVSGSIPVVGSQAGSREQVRNTERTERWPRKNSSATSRT